MTSITVITGSGDTADKTAITNTDGKAPQFTNKTITIPWVDTNGANLYVNGATLEIKYHATVADTATIAGAGNTNKVTVTPQTKDGDDTPSKGESEETISTYAIALKKTDDKGNPLAGATFELPFYVKTAAANDGSYIYAGAKTTTSTAPVGTTDKLTTPSTGEITIKGVASGSYKLTETEAPKGYNKLIDKVTIKAEKLTTTKTSTTFYIDANGNKTDVQTDTSVAYNNDNIAASAVLVINKTGAKLPSTGGMGTTIFYVLGAALVIGAGVVLVTRRRLSK